MAQIERSSATRSANHRMRLASRTAAFAVVACGGGGGDATAVGAAPAPAPAPAPAVNPSPTAVGTPAGVAVTQTIGPAGGILVTADGAVTLTFPAGALAANASVGIQPISNNAINGVGPAYRFTPEGTTFAQPVQLTFAYNDSMLAGSAAQTLEAATQDAQGHWWMLPNPSRDLNAKTISVGMSHFSDWSLLQGQQLRPGSATVPVSGTQDLTLIYREEDDMLVTPQTLAGAHQYDCTSDLAPPLPASNWAVNGVLGGRTGLVFVSPTGGQVARCSAPAGVPTPPLLAVSAETHDARYGTLTLIANISIAGGGYAGSVDVSAGDNGGTIGAQHVEVTWGRLDPDPLSASGGATYQGHGRLLRRHLRTQFGLRRADSDRVPRPVGDHPRGIRRGV